MTVELLCLAFFLFRLLHELERNSIDFRILGAKLNAKLGQILGQLQQ